MDSSSTHLLERAIAAAVVDNPQEDGDPASIENRWAASSFLESLLRESVALCEWPDRRELQQAIDTALGLPGALLMENLEQKNLLRQSVGRFSVPWGIGVHLRRVNRTEDASAQASQHLEPQEVRALDAVNELIHVRAERWVPEAVVRGLRDAHAIAHPDTPSLDELVKDGLLTSADDRGGSPGFQMSLRKRQWFGIMRRAGALLWERLLRAGSEPADALDAWLEKVEYTALWVHAPKEMSGLALEAWLDEAVARVLAEPDLDGEDWDEELLKVRLDGDAPFVSWRRRAASPPAGSNATDRYLWWERMMARNKGVVIRNDCRRPVDALIAALVQHDPSRDGCRRIRALLEESATRPHLARVIPQMILTHRPAAVASLIAHRETTALGLLLLLRVNVADDRALAIGTEAAQRQHNRLATLWAQALEPAVDVIRRLQPRDASNVLLAVLLELSDASSRANPFRPDLGLIASAAAAELLEQTLGVLATVALPYPFNSAQRQFLPTIGTEMFDGLSRALASHEAMLGRAPFAEWKLLFWLLDMASKEMVNAAIGKDAARALAESFRQELERTREGRRGNEIGVEVTWVDDRPQVAELPWHRVARLLDEIADLDQLLSPVESPDLGRAGADFGLRVESWTNRKRLRLRMLLRVHASVRAETSSDEALIQRIEEEIALALVSNCEDTNSDPLFSARLEGVGLGADTVDLLRSTVRAIDSFSPGSRRKIIDAWLAKEQEPAILITTVAEITADEARQVVLKRLAELDLSAALAELSTFPSALRIARDAVDGGLLQLAEQVLDWGDARSEGAGFRAEWVQQAYTLRLAIVLVGGGDDEALAAVPMPPSSDVEDPSVLEQSRQFHLALSLIARRPEKGIATLERLLQDRPTSTSLHVNLFAAKNEAANLIKDERERHAALAAGLREWQSALASLPSSEVAMVEAAAAYNTLFVLAGTGRFEAFEEYWGRLDPAIRYRQSYVQLAITTFAEQRRTRQAEAILREARTFHSATSAPPDWIVAIGTQFQLGLTTAVPAAEQHWRVLEPTINNYRGWLADMKRLPAHEISAIFGRRPNEPLGEFLLFQHVAVVEQMLISHMTLRLLNDEDKYSHVFSALLEARLAHLGWSVAEQSPGGQSGGDAPAGSRGGPGERDWVIRGDEARELAVVEALRIRHRSLGSVKMRASILAHADKVFRYDAIGREHAYVVAYVEVDDIDGVTRDYREQVKEMKFAAAELKELRELDEHRAVNLRVLEAAYARQGVQVRVYHLLVRLPEAAC